MSICRICGNDRQNRPYTAREMMFGLRDRFGYFQCARCGCLQIEEFPENLSRYYPPDYYSYAPHGDRHPPGRLRRRLKAWRLDHWLNGGNPAGRLAAAVFGAPEVTDSVLREARDVASLRPSSPVLDVGCGSGGRLMEWSSYGFLDLQGFDPFIADDIRYANGVTIFKSLPANGRRYRFVMMHHSFEHMADPRAVLDQVAGQLADDHMVMIAIPLCSSLAWEKYGVDWVQLDAPRHFFLHSVESMTILAEAAGFHVERVIHNSGGFQFWGSEQYVRDIPLRDPRSRAESRDSELFSDAQMAAFDAEAARVNQAGLGDQASFYLTRRH